MKAHSKSIYEILKCLKTNPQKGLSVFEARKRLQRCGENVLKDEKSNNISKKIWAQLSDFMIVILLISASISFSASILRGNTDFVDSIIILAIVVINTSIGIVQETRAEKAIEALKKLSSPQTNVIRSEKQQKISSKYVVPGDILVLRAGDLVPADCRIVKSSNLKVIEASLTGETFPVEKDENLILPEKTQTADQKNMLFSSSTIDSGKALCTVTQTGMSTQIGKIAHLINSEPELPSPLQKKLTNLSKVIGVSTVGISLIIFILGVIQGINLTEMFMIAISLAVAAIPEGLPATITIVLASGMRKMAMRGAIVRNLSAIETLGSTSVICSDKTGTLTMNKMTLTAVRSINFQEKFDSDFGKKIISLGALCTENTNPKLGKVHESPTEAAILKIAQKFTIGKSELQKLFPKINEISFDSRKKYMVTFHKYGQKNKVILKGAPETIIKFCSKFETKGGIFNFSYETFKKFESMNEKMAKEGLRVIAVAYKDVDDCSDYQNGLIFCGFLGISDPLRPEAKNAVLMAQRAGIKSVIVTGDHVCTAETIAKQLGILEKNQQSITGNELENMSQKQLERSIWKYSVFARVSPEHKVRIVKAFKACGAVVAMTGDGINDAPALKTADIGCAMGKSGTDVAKSASDMILTDDNFATIIEAIKQGRGMFENIKKTVHFLLSTNIGEVIAVLLAFILKLPTPLLAIHLLWINLVTDSFPALALGVDPVNQDIMKKSIKSQNSIFSKRRVINIMVEGFFIAVLGILSFVLGRVFYDGVGEPVIGRTMAFATLGICEVIHSFNVQSRKSLFKTGFLSNVKLVFSVIFCIALQATAICIPSLTSFFKTKFLSMDQWLIVIGVSLLPLLISEVEKIITNFKFDKKNYTW